VHDDIRQAKLIGTTSCSIEGQLAAKRDSRCAAGFMPRTELVQGLHQIRRVPKIEPPQPYCAQQCRLDFGQVSLETVKLGNRRSWQANRGMLQPA
jgi:hypothetical protein